MPAGCAGEAFGEIVFNTSMSGYQEILSDPSYAGQIVAMTYPHIGNYGVNEADAQSRGCFCRGLVVRAMCDTPSNFRAEMSLPAYLAARDIVAIEGIDTRKLVRHVREHGAMKAVISTECDDIPSLAKRLEGSSGSSGTTSPPRSPASSLMSSRRFPVAVVIMSSPLTVASRRAYSMVYARMDAM